MANRLDVESLRHPDGPALDEALDVLSPNQRDVIAKPLLEQVEEHPAVAALRLGHVHEDLRGSGVALLQALRNLLVILPISGRKSWSIIAGIPSLGVALASAAASSVSPGGSCRSKRSPASSRL